MKVAVTDYTFPDLAIERGILAPLGCEIAAGQCKTADTLIPLTRDADCVLTQFAPLTAEVIDAMRKVRAIIRYGIGYDNVDCEAARSKGVPVCNIPEFCINEVADHTVAFILAVTRNLWMNCSHVRKGQWGLAVPLERMHALADQIVGIVGFGRIGRAVTSRLIPFGCRILVHDPLVPAGQIDPCASVSLSQLLAASDIVTLHCPASAQTCGMINRQTLAGMKPGAVLVNVGRGALVDTDALVESLRSGHLSAAALDVFEPEPLPAGHPLLSMENVVVSPHIASASPKAARRLRETAAAMAVLALRGEPLPNIVNGVTQHRSAQEMP